VPTASTSSRHGSDERPYDSGDLSHYPPSVSSKPPAWTAPTSEPGAAEASTTTNGAAATPDARLGRGRRGFYLGYRTVFLTDIEGFPIGHIEAPANVNEPLMVEPLLDRVLGEDLEVELLAGDSGFESRRVFDALEARRMAPLVAWRRMRGRENSPDVLTVKDRIDVEGPEWMRAVYKRLRAVVEGFIGRVKCRLGYGRLTWQGLENASIHVSLVLMVVYAVAIAAFRIGRPELRQSVAFFS